ESSRAGVVFEEQRCPYPGRRRGLLMNVSALRQMSKKWNAILADVSFLRAEYIRRNKVETFDIGHAWRFGVQCTALPAYLFRRSSRPLRSGELPARITGMFKAMIAVPVLVQRMLLRKGLPLDGCVEHHEYHDFAEETGAFEGAPGRVCAAPESMVDD